MGQAAAEVLAALAHQHVRRGTPQDLELARVYERMADKMQGGIVGGYRPSAGGPIPAAPRTEPAVTHASDADIERREIAVEPCQEHEAAILRIVKAHVGKQSAISAARIGIELGGVIDRVVREIISHLCTVHEQPICSRSSRKKLPDGTREEPGFFWPATREELIASIASDQSRIDEIAARLRGKRAGGVALFGTGVLPGME